MHDIRNHELFAALSKNECTAIRNVIDPRHFAKDQTLIDQSHPSPGAYAVTTGEVTISVRQPDSSQFAIFSVESPTLVGERALIDAEIPTAMVRATSPVSAIFIDRQRFAGLCAQGHPASAKILGTLTRILHRRCSALDKMIARAVAAQKTDNGHPHNLLTSLPVTLPAATAGHSPESLANLDTRAIAHWGEPVISALFDQSHPIRAQNGEAITSESKKNVSGFVILRGSIATVLPENNRHFPILVDGPGRIPAITLPGADPATEVSYVARTSVIGLGLPENFLTELINNVSKWDMADVTIPLLQAICAQLSLDMRRKNHFLVRISASFHTGMTDNDSLAAAI